MQQYFQFLTEQWLLTSAFVVIIILLLANELYAAKKGAKKCTPSVATRLLNQENAQAIDVREKAEFKSGHITGSKNIPLSVLTTKDPNLSHDKPIIVVCRVGQRAQKGALLLKKQGYTKVYVLSGGVTAWRNDGLPLVK